VEVRKVEGSWIRVCRILDEDKWVVRTISEAEVRKLARLVEMQSTARDEIDRLNLNYEFTSIRVAMDRIGYRAEANIDSYDAYGIDVYIARIENTDKMLLLLEHYRREGLRAPQITYDYVITTAGTVREAVSKILGCHTI